jgi:nucleotide-binding universal stress UspA family protein
MSALDPIFKKAVVGVAFSPRLNAVLNEAHRLLKILGTWPIIVHVGEDTSSNRIKLEEAIERSNFKNHPPIFLIRSGSASDVLVSVAKEYHADLIVAGALKKEGLFKYYFGSVARNLARNAPCSVMLFTDPHVKPEPMEKLHLAAEYDPEAELAVNVASSVASSAGTKELYITHTFQIPAWEEKKQVPRETDEIKKIYQKEDEKLQKFLKKFDFYGFSVHTRCLYERNRATTLNFTRQVHASLLIIAAPINRLGLWDRLFPQNLELALQNLPCSLLLTRKSST